MLHFCVHKHKNVQKIYKNVTFIVFPKAVTAFVHIAHVYLSACVQINSGVDTNPFRGVPLSSSLL